MPTQTLCPRLIGGPPPPVYTGGYAISTGFADELQDGFDAYDLQGLNAPDALPSGGMTTFGWVSHIDKSRFVVLSNTVRRPV